MCAAAQGNYKGDIIDVGKQLSFESNNQPYYFSATPPNLFILGLYTYL